MKPPPSIAHIPPPTADHPRLVTIVAIGLGGLALGWLLARASLDRDRVGESVSDERASAAPEPAPDAGRATSATVAVAQPESSVRLGTDGGTPGVPPDASTERPAPDRRRRMVPGRIAYIRCDGAEINRGPIPCPRDRAFERAVWGRIRPLVGCADLPTQTGAADLRIRFEGGITEVFFQPRPNPLDEARVAACIGAGLTGLHSTIPASSLVVSFRFRLAR